MSWKVVSLGCMLAWSVCQGVTYGDVSSGEFGYQGQLKQSGVPVNDICDFEFSLWRDAVSTLPADQVGVTLTFDGLAGNGAAVDIVNGLFNAQLDFGTEAFNDDLRWLEVAVSCPTGVGVYTTLSPREKISAVPRAIRTRGIAVDDAGQVGIGTEFPDQLLDVAGNISLRAEGFDPFIELTSDDSVLGTPMRIMSLGRFGLAVTDGRNEPRMIVGERGGVGIGTTLPRTLLHVTGTGSFLGNHVAFFENTAGSNADGIAIRINNPSTNRENNFITFLNGNGRTTGRIEGFDLHNGDWLVPPPPPMPDIGVTLDPGISYNPNWLNLGSLPTASLNPGQLPTASLNRGSLPTASLTGGSLPSLSFSRGSLPSAQFSRGSLPTLTFNDGSLPTFSASFCSVFGVNVLCGFNFSAGSTPTASLARGTLPSLTFSRGSLPSASFTRGSFPTLSFSGGSLPLLTFNGGALPSLTFDGGTLPSVVASPLIFGEPSLTFELPTQAELEALFCWAEETGNSSFVQLDPVSLAMANIRAEVAKRCKDEGVTYGSKGADYAEWLPKLNPEDRFQFAQIVGVHGGKVSLKTEGAEQIMAISRAPVVVGNVPPEDQEDKYTTVGFMGQLPVVVRGKVKAGDYIIPSGLEDGTAVAVSPGNLELQHLGRTLGRAWADSDNEVYGLVNVAIGLNGNEEKIILEKQRDRIEAQGRQQAALVAENIQLRSELAGLQVELRNVLAMVQKLEDQSPDRGACAQVVAVADGSR